MNGKRADVDFERCRPEDCGPDGGPCPAVLACTHGLLEQEDAGESPMLMSVRMCSGCGKCAKACPLEAIRVVSG